MGSFFRYVVCIGVGVFCSIPTSADEANPFGASFISPVCYLVSAPAEARPAIQSSPQQRQSLSSMSNEVQLKVFRIAISASGEFTQANGGTVDSAMAAITNILNRINAIYETDLGVRLELVPNNQLLVYTNPNTDPFTRNDPSELTINENHTNVNSVIGLANYDLGLVFNTAFYGLAYVRSVCNDGFKGRGCIGTGTTPPEFFYLVAAHEIGHQFGANHTFNSVQGHCGQQTRNAWSAFEPGSGSTLMSYAGIGCASDELQPIVDGYFHSKSLEEIQSYLLGLTCASEVASGNRPPTVSAGRSYDIPKETPFILTAIGSDPDGDPLTYTWEQTDLGPEQPLYAPDNGQGPLFRSLPPSSSPSRTFPNLNFLLANQVSPGEILPQTNRYLHFRVTARDGRRSGAGVASANLDLTVDNTSGPFRVVFPNSNVQLIGNQTVQWDAARTALAPVNAARVNILLSTNGGTNFQFLLATNTLNDGSEPITLPDLNTTTARIKIEAVDNIFFDISDADFRIGALHPPVFSSISKTNNTLLLRWNSLAGEWYRVQSRPHGAGQWSDLPGDIQATNSVSIKADVINDGAGRFYRVQVLP